MATDADKIPIDNVVVIQGDTYEVEYIVDNVNIPNLTNYQMIAQYREQAQDTTIQLTFVAVVTDAILKKFKVSASAGSTALQQVASGEWDARGISPVGVETTFVKGACAISFRVSR